MVTAVRVSYAGFLEPVARDLVVFLVEVCTIIALANS